MKKILLSMLLCVLGTIGGGLALSSCSDDDDWYPGGGYFYDIDLVGYWKLYQVNGVRVQGTQVNYLDFVGRGSGYYYYYDNALPFTERISYYCSSGYSTDNITIQYANGQVSTMDYWFSDNGRSLWLSWNSYSGTYTYLYRLTNGVPW